MKRALRIVILGPIIALMLLLMLLVLPIKVFLDWLMDIDDDRAWAIYRDMYRETLGSLW